MENVPGKWLTQFDDLPKGDENKKHQWLVLDGEVLQKQPSDSWACESESPPKLVIGTTAHESHSENLIENLLNKYKEWTPTMIRQHIQQSKIGELGLTDEVFKRYNATYQGLVKMISDIRTVCPLLMMARVQPYVPFYVATKTQGEFKIADMYTDIFAILGYYEPRTYEQRWYAQTMQKLFFDYVVHDEIKQFNPRKRVLIIDEYIHSQEDYNNCDFWIMQDFVPRYARID